MSVFLSEKCRAEGRFLELLNREIAVGASPSASAREAVQGTLSSHCSHFQSALCMFSTFMYSLGQLRLLRSVLSPAVCSDNFFLIFGTAYFLVVGWVFYAYKLLVLILSAFLNPSKVSEQLLPSTQSVRCSGKTVLVCTQP